MSTDNRPDVLILMTDQLNPHCLGYAGDPVIKTPNIDELAREGTSFNKAYTVCPVCMPARCSIISGLYPHNHGFWTNFTDHVFPTELGSMFRDIRHAGYRTAHVGKSHWFNLPWGDDYADRLDYYSTIGIEHAVEIPGPYMTPFCKSAYSEHLQSVGLWDAYARDIAMRLEKGQYVLAPSPLPPDEHNDSLVGRKAIEFIENCPTDHRFCLHASFPGPHSPLDAPGEYADLFDPKTIELPPNIPDVVKSGANEYSRDEMKRMRANYYGKIALIDHWCGKIIDTLKRRGTWDNTLVIFTADHGEHMGAHGRLGKCHFNDESARIPMILRWPGRVRTGQSTPALAEVIDIYPTILDAIGGTPSFGRFGTSLLPVASGETDSVHDAVFSEISGGKKGMRYMVRTPQHKWWISPGQEHLYDMDSDPYEMTNLAERGDCRDLPRDMRQRLSDFLVTSQYDWAHDYIPLFGRARIAMGSEEVHAEKFVELFEKLHQDAR